MKTVIRNSFPTIVIIAILAVLLVLLSIHGMPSIIKFREQIGGTN